MSTVHWWSKEYTFVGESEPYIQDFKQKLVVSKLEGNVFQKISCVKEWNELADLSKRVEGDAITHLACVEQLNIHVRSGESKRIKTYVLVAVTIASLALTFFAPSSLPFRSFFQGLLKFNFLLGNLLLAVLAVQGLKGSPYGGKRAFILSKKSLSYKELFFSLICPPLAAIREVYGRSERLTKFVEDSYQPLKAGLSEYDGKCREFLRTSDPFEKDLEKMDRPEGDGKGSVKPPMSRHLLYTNKEVAEGEVILDEEPKVPETIAQVASKVLQNLRRMRAFFSSHNEGVAEQPAGSDL